MRNVEQSPIRELTSLAKKRQATVNIIHQRERLISGVASGIISPQVKPALLETAPQHAATRVIKKSESEIDRLSTKVEAIDRRGEALALPYYSIYRATRDGIVEMLKAKEAGIIDEKKVEPFEKGFQRINNLQGQIPGLRAGLGRNGIWPETPEEVIIAEKQDFPGATAHERGKIQTEKEHEKPTLRFKPSTSGHFATLGNLDGKSFRMIPNSGLYNVLELLLTGKAFTEEELVESLPRAKNKKAFNEVVAYLKMRLKELYPDNVVLKEEENPQRGIIYMLDAVVEKIDPSPTPPSEKKRRRKGNVTHKSNRRMASIGEKDKEVNPHKSKPSYKLPNEEIVTGKTAEVLRILDETSQDKRVTRDNLARKLYPNVSLFRALKNLNGALNRTTAAIEGSGLKIVLADEPQKAPGNTSEELYLEKSATPVKQNVSQNVTEQGTDTKSSHAA